MLNQGGAFRGMNLTKDNYFIDTNIIVYLFDKESIEKQKTSKQIIKHALERGTGTVSFQVIQEFCNVALKKFKKPLKPEDCKQFINKFLYPICGIFPGTELYNYALDIKENSGLSFYDSLVIACAYMSKCKVLYSEDLQDGQTVMGIKILNPFK